MNAHKGPWGRYMYVNVAFSDHRMMERWSGAFLAI